MTLYETVISNLKGVVGSNKNGIPLQHINNEYEFITGDRFPLRDLGFETIPLFIKSVPNLFRIQNSGYGPRVFNVVNKNESESNLILYDMIKNTNSKKGSKFKKFAMPIGRQYPFSNIGFESKFKIPFGCNKFPPKPFINFQIQVQSDGSQNKENFQNPNKFGSILNDLNEYVISDSEIEEPRSISVEVQTSEIQYKKLPESFISMKSLEFITIIIDIIVEFKPLNLDDVVFFKISTDLYYFFNLFTGLNIDPSLFQDIVLSAISSLKCMEMYENLIYSDDTKKYCCLNLATTNYTIIHLPFLEFNLNMSYNVEISAVNSTGIVSVKFSEESSKLLRWTKSRPLSDEAKLTIENQQFWSWIPGSLCLVQLPHNLVKSLNILSVERAIIVSTEMAPAVDVMLQRCSHVVLHRTTFYLIDHNRFISNVLSSNSSFQSVKRTAYRNNDTNIAYVCNVSIRARCMPSKVQFLDIRNYQDVAHLFHDRTGNFVANQSLVIYQVCRIDTMINFQPIYECYARINKWELENDRPIQHYDIDMVAEYKDNKNRTPVSKKEEVEVIVISDSDIELIDLTGDDDENVKNRKVDKKKCDSDMSISSSEDGLKDEEKDATSLVNGAMVDEDKISVISYTDDEERVETVDLDGEEDNNNSIASNISQEQQPEFQQVEEKEQQQQLETLSKPKQSFQEKCIIPITTNLCATFEGKVVKIMHLQSGAAVIGLLESTAFIKRERKMLSLAHLELEGVLNTVTNGDFFLWSPIENIDYIKSYNNKSIALVEILQVLNDEMVMVSLIHYGLVITLKIDELCHIPYFHNGDNSASDLQELIGPLVGAFDLHMIPNWFNVVIDSEMANKLFTAFFINDEELVLEYFDSSCRFLNLELITQVEHNLMNNHCNIRSKSFITTLSQSLMACRLYIGSLLVLSSAIVEDAQFEGLPIINALTRVTDGDDTEIWFASIDIENENGEVIQKLSPHCFTDDKFCIDRVRINKSENKLRLLDYHDIDVEIPEYLDGIYKFDQKLLSTFMKSNAEFYSRYMLIGAIKIPDLNYLFNKLIF